MKGFVNSRIVHLDFCIQLKVFWSSRKFSLPYLTIPLITSISAGGAIRNTSPLASALLHFPVRSTSLPTPTQTFVSGIYRVIVQNARRSVICVPLVLDHLPLVNQRSLPKSENRPATGGRPFKSDCGFSWFPTRQSADFCLVLHGRRNQPESIEVVYIAC